MKMQPYFSRKHKHYRLLVTVNFVHKKRLAECYQWTVTITVLSLSYLLPYTVTCHLSSFIFRQYFIITEKTKNAIDFTKETQSRSRNISKYHVQSSHTDKSQEIKYACHKQMQQAQKLQIWKLILQSLHILHVSYNHQRNLECDRILKHTKVKSGALL